MRRRRWNRAILAVALLAGGVSIARETFGQTVAGPQPRPRLPEVIRPSGNDGRDGQTQSDPIFATLPSVIRSTDRSQQTGESGTGFFIASNGVFLTVGHVVRACRAIAILSKYLKETPARLLAIDSRNDIAVLQAKNLRPPATLAMVDRPTQAENLAIFGYPGDGDKSAATEIGGRMRAERLPFETGNRKNLLWMEANGVRHGFSGGPVLNANGDVVGVINGHVTQRTSVRGAVVREAKYVFGASTDTVAAFLTREVPAIVLDAGRSPPPHERDQAVVRVICWH
jgi:putative serine protease PepD